MTPSDFEHLDCLNARFDDETTFSISIVRHAETGQLFIEVLHGEHEERFAYAPLALPEEAARWDGVWEGIADTFGWRAGL
ncbi:hypothetical protein [Nonomuraea sp. bgisy101]|uniref:hypothetical protein n=1 Tax=Nonomuraea sp. bgisy101 TaxID=3413784 RepID=UPI003D764F08